MRVLIDEASIRKKVKELASLISEKYKGQKLVVIIVLKGAFIFAADLIREIEGVDIYCDFVKASSYGMSTVSCKDVRIDYFPEVNIKGERILVVDDILDAGYTLKKIVDEITSRSPESCEVCVLLDKPERREVEVKVDYVGFVIPNKFVVGYGMDCKEKYRNLKCVAVYEE